MAVKYCPRANMRIHASRSANSTRPLLRIIGRHPISARLSSTSHMSSHDDFLTAVLCTIQLHPAFPRQPTLHASSPFVPSICIRRLTLYLFCVSSLPTPMSSLRFRILDFAALELMNQCAFNRRQDLVAPPSSAFSLQVLDTSPRARCSFLASPLSLLIDFSIERSGSHCLITYHTCHISFFLNQLEYPQRMRGHFVS